MRISDWSSDVCSSDLMSGLRLGIGKAVIGIVIAEFQTAISGLGGIIITSANGFRTAEMFVPVILIMVVAVALSALVGWLEKVRSAERCVGKECVSKLRSLGSPDH